MYLCRMSTIKKLFSSENEVSSKRFFGALILLNAVVVWNVGFFFKIEMTEPYTSVLKVMIGAGMTLLGLGLVDKLFGSK